jgi:hypothetical protein
MRSIRKAVLEDVGALSDCDREFGFGSWKEFVERAIRRSCISRRLTLGDLERLD